LKASAVVVMLLKILWVVTLKMGQTSDPETLVVHQKTTPCNNPEDFKQRKIILLQNMNIGLNLEDFFFYF
jgi:hypothetical protein